jgi:redox-regulated HSP33 family molecular chaperone
MSESEQSLQELVVQILEDEDAVAITTGLFVQRLKHQYGIEKDRSELSEFLDELVEEGVLEYNHGEYGEYAIPS